MSLLDLGEKIRKILNVSTQNLRAWGQVATQPKLRQEYSQRVAKPAIQSKINRAAVSLAGPNFSNWSQDLEEDYRKRGVFQGLQSTFNPLLMNKHVYPIAEPIVSKLRVGRYKLSKQWEKEQPYMKAQLRAGVSLPPETPASYFLTKTPIGQKVRAAIEKPRIPYGKPGTFLTTKKPQIGWKQPGKLLTSFLTERPETTQVRAKLQRGEDLTGEEKRIAQIASQQQMMGFTGGVKTVRGVNPQMARKILNVKKGATAKEINKAFRILAKKEWPRTIQEVASKNKTTAARIVGEAKDILLNEAKKIKIVPRLGGAVEGVSRKAELPIKIKGELPKIKVPESPRIKIIQGGDPVQKVINALKGAPRVRTKQEALYALERAKRTAKVAGVGKMVGGEKGYFAQLGQLKGKLPKVEFESIRKQISQDDIDSLFNKVEQSTTLLPLEKVSTKTGLSKLLGAEGGSVPTKGELKLLNEVFPPEFVQAVLDKRSLTKKLFQAGVEALNVPRAIMATADMSAPLRQGVFLIGRPKTWGPAFKSMVKSFFNEKSYQGMMDDIKSRPTYKAMRRNKLSLTELDGMLTSREETFMSQLPERIPLFGKVARASNRAYVGFLNKLRADTFDDLYRTAQSQNLVKGNPKLTHDIANFVNAATGRGGLGKLEGAAVALNSTFFSPRLMASRLNLLNPAYYAKLEPFVRKQALKSLFTFLGTGLTVLTLAKMGGAKVGSDPRSADFGKIKIGNTRLDIWGGFQQYVRLAGQLISGKLISSTTGKEYTLGEGYKPITRLGIMGRALEYKEAPVISFATALLKNQDVFGQKPNWGAEVINRFTPMVVQDMYDLYKERGLVGIGMATPAIFGIGVQTYGEQVPIKDVTATGKPKVSFINKPGLGEDVWAKITGDKREEIISDPTLYPEYLRKKQAKVALDKAKQEARKKGIKISATEPALTIGLPKEEEASKELYKDAVSKVKSLESRLLTMPYEPREKINEISREYDIREKQNELERYKRLLNKFETERPEQVFEYKIDTYRSGGGQKVDTRAKWVADTLRGLEGKERQEMINRLWDEKVITKGASGVAQYLKDNFNLDVWNYTSSTGSTGKGRKTTKAKAVKKVSYRKISIPKVKMTKIRHRKMPVLKIAKPPTMKTTARKARKIPMPAYKAPTIKISKPKGLTVGRYR